MSCLSTQVVCQWSSIRSRTKAYVLVLDVLEARHFLSCKVFITGNLTRRCILPGIVFQAEEQYREKSFELQILQLTPIKVPPSLGLEVQLLLMGMTISALP